jgi:hypothetical protein
MTCWYVAYQVLEEIGLKTVGPSNTPSVKEEVLNLGLRATERAVKGLYEAPGAALDLISNGSNRFKKK